MISRVLILPALMAPAAARAADWPNWRGPSLNGSVTGSPLAGRDAFDLEVAWKREPGSGRGANPSGPATGFDRALVASDHADGRGGKDRDLLDKQAALGFGVKETVANDAPGWWSWSLQALEAPASGTGGNPD